MSSTEKVQVLFVCTGNAGRSQMAQALFRQHAGTDLRAESAGVAPWTHLHPMAVRLMRERGAPLDGHFPKSVTSLAHERFDVVVTLGDVARRRLPRAQFSGAYWLHWDIADPADADGTPNSELVFRTAMHAIDARLPELARRARELPRLSRFCSLPGISTGVWGTERLVPPRHLAAAKEAGFQAVELNLYKGRDHFDWHDAGAVLELRTAADGLGMLIWSVHSPDLGSVAADDAAERRRQIDAVKRCLDIAEQLGARVVVSHALLFGPFREAPDICEMRISEFLDELAGPVEQSPAHLGFENAGFPAPPAVRTQGLLRRLQDISPAAFGFVLDTGHSHLDGDIGSLLQMGLDTLVSVHLNDNDGRGDLHQVPGEGMVNWDLVRDVLRTIGYRGVWMYEIEPGVAGPAERLRKTMAHHRRSGPASE